MNRLSWVMLCAGFLAFASPALCAERPLTLPPGALVSGINDAGAAAGLSSALRAGVSATAPVPPKLLTGLIQQINPALFTGMGLITFPDAAGGLFPGTNYDGIVAGTFAERFVGQILSTNTVSFTIPHVVPSPLVLDYDALSGLLGNPLALQVGAPNQNLAIFFFDLAGADVLAGLGPGGYGQVTGTGEGSVAVRFLVDQSEVGFDADGVDGDGDILIKFFRRDGSNIDTIDVPTIMHFGCLDNTTLACTTDADCNVCVAGGCASNPTQSCMTPSDCTDICVSVPSNLTLAFQHVGGVQDIAGFSIENTDPYGLGYTNFRFDNQQAPSVPTLMPTLSPGMLAVLIGVLGFVGSLAVRRSLWR